MVKARKVKGIRPNAPVIENARRIILTRLEEMRSFAPWVEDKRNVEEIHNLRIAAKRLRYSLELFRFALPREAAGLIDEVKEIQEHIGTMRDADVMIVRVFEIIESDARQRADRLLEIAVNVERGSVAQRRQRLASATASRSAPRDEVAFFTLIAHQAEIRDAAYERFLTAWRQMEATDFPTRALRLVGAASDATERPPEATAPAEPDAG